MQHTEPTKYVPRPASPEEDKAGLFFALTPEQDAKLGCIGHVRIDFGSSGKGFYHTWHPRGPEELNTPEFKAELTEVVDELRKSVLRSLGAMSSYCCAHGGAITGGWVQNYGYVVETERYKYLLRCNPVRGDYQAYLSCFDCRVQKMGQRERSAHTFAEGLPEMCWSVLPGTGKLICIKRGERGYYPSDWDTGDPAENRKIADYSNQKRGISKAQEEAMLCGSMRGWDVPGADPKAYKQDTPDEPAAVAKRLVDEDKLPKLLAIMEAAGCKDPDDVIDLAGQLEQYVFDPKLRTYEDIAMSDLNVIAGGPAVELLVPHLDLNGYGQAVAEKMNLTLTSHGAVSRRDGQPIRTFGNDGSRQD